MNLKAISVTILLFYMCLVTTVSHAQNKTERTIYCGSKKFTENVILGEILTQLTRSQGINAAHRRELGGTRVLWNALLNGDIDMYPEYTGTLKEEILKEYRIQTDEALQQKLAEMGVTIAARPGFNNTYAIGMRAEVAEKLGITKISDLHDHPRLKFGFTNEFIDRGDGWNGLRTHYNLPQQDVRGLDHDLAYRGIASGAIDVIDMYSTDAEIEYYQLLALTDDRHYFPEYDAVILLRSETLRNLPALAEALATLNGSINEQQMIRMNARVKIDGMAETTVAAAFIRNQFGIESETHVATFWQRFRKHTVEHLVLVAISLAMAIVLAIPLGILAVKCQPLETAILGTTAIIQTIPSLALLVFMIPLLGIGERPAILALFLYSLLPIVRNTYTGIRDIPGAISDSALALGLPAMARLRLIELPMAASMIIAGIKTAAVINVGTATLGALIGAGGYGQPILTGIRLDDIGLIFEGAVPAALLALLVQGLFDLLERLLVPKGLRA